MSISHVTKGFVAHFAIIIWLFGMIFNKAHVAIAGHRLGECQIPVALRILYTQTVGILISRRIVCTQQCLPLV